MQLRQLQHQPCSPNTARLQQNQGRCIPEPQDSSRRDPKEQRPGRISIGHSYPDFALVSRRSRLLLAAGIFSLAALSLLTGAAQSNDPVTKPIVVPQAKRLPDADDQTKMRDQQAKQQSFDAASVERKKQLSDDSAKLLTLAMALKAEVDKTNKDMLSLSVVRKADEIEKLARNVREKMKLTVGGS